MSRVRRPSRQMILLLAALAGRPRVWHHGYDLMKETELKSGTLYPLLMRMGEQGIVEAEWREPSQAGRPARHAYRLTATGLALARDLEARESDSSPSGMSIA